MLIISPPTKNGVAAVIVHGGGRMITGTIRITGVDRRMISAQARMITMNAAMTIATTGLIPAEPVMIGALPGLITVTAVISGETPGMSTVPTRMISVIAGVIPVVRMNGPSQGAGDEGGLGTPKDEDGLCPHR